MAPASIKLAPTPPRSIVAIATLASQLLGTLAFALAFVWVFKHGDRQPLSVAILVLGAVCVFAGGNAHRGSVRALVVCAVLDIAFAIVCLANLSGAKAFLLAPVAWAAPAIAGELALAMTITGIVAALAASTCIAAVPQTRRFAAWRSEQIMHAVRAWRV
jgi:drug/metabolite transporter (DMT)-like permease